MSDHYRHGDGIREIEGAPDRFARLKAEGVKVVLDTGFSRDIANVVLHRLDWADSHLIDETITMDEVANGRPLPDMIFEAMRLTGVTNANLVA